MSDNIVIGILGHKFIIDENRYRANLRCEVCDLRVYDCSVESSIYDRTNYKGRIVYFKNEAEWSDVDVSCDEFIIKKLLE
jgi:hypothetical protein